MNTTELKQFGITVVDTLYTAKKVAAMYIMVQNDEVAIIETGTKHSIQYIQKALTQLSLTFENVKYIIPTHIHLDHAAGAGGLMKLCPNAKLIIHPRGAKHMVDPTKLIAGTIAVYGEQKFNELYGELTPIDENRIIIADDNYKLLFANRELTFIDTPGHASHHFCIFDSLSKLMFTGDTFGVSYREFDTNDNIFIFPTTTPVQFDPETLINSIDRIMSFNPAGICLTHFGVITPNEKIVNNLKEGINYFRDLANKYFTDPNAKDVIKGKMMNYLLDKLKFNTTLSEDFCRKKLTMDVELNTQGIIFWQQKINLKK